MLLPTAHPQDDPQTGIRVKPEDLFTVFTKLADENLKVGKCPQGFLASTHSQFPEVYTDYRSSSCGLCLQPGH